MSEVDPTATTDQLRAAEKRRAAAAIADAASEASREQLAADVSTVAEPAPVKPSKTAKSAAPKGRSSRKQEKA